MAYIDILGHKREKYEIVAEGYICYTSETRAAKSHEVKSTFLPCSIRYFSPDFS